MTKVMVDAATQERLLGLKEPLELCDESGRVLGAFTPEPGSPPGGATPEALGDREAEAAPGRDLEMNVYGSEKDLE